MGQFYFIVAEYFGYTCTHSVVTNAIKTEMARVAKLYIELPQTETATPDGKHQQADIKQLTQLRTTLELTNKVKRKAGYQQKDYAYRLADELIQAFDTTWAMYIATLVTNNKIRTKISDAIIWRIL